VKKKVIAISIVLGMGILLLGNCLMSQRVCIDEVEASEVGVSHEEIEEIENIISKSLRIQYGRGTNYILNEVTVQKINDEKLIISVQVYSPDILIHHFILEKSESGRYLISNIENDI